jgi:2-amino-4-hydroxy-6-hydroxymethyldihydropteridine diphosphokinase
VLLGYLHAIEERHGRAPRTADQARWQDRTLDLDLIAHGDVVCDTPTLVLPHPRAHERDFVLRPWLAVDPEAVLPGRGRVDALLAGLTGSAS